MWAILTAAAAADYRLFCVMFIINFSNKCRGQLRFPLHQWKSATDQSLVYVHFTLPCVVNYFCFTGNLEINWLLISLKKINVFNSTALCCCCSKCFIFDNVTLSDTCCNEGIKKIHVHLLKKHFPKMFSCLEFFFCCCGQVLLSQIQRYLWKMKSMTEAKPHRHILPVQSAPCK